MRYQPGSDDSPPATNRRRFSRVPFDALVHVRQGDRHWRAPLVDLSLRGLLMHEPTDWNGADPAQPLQVDIHLDEQACIAMEMRQRHCGDGLVGLHCERIDLDSIGALRRLVELNLGDAALLERELGALGEWPEPGDDATGPN